MPHPAKYRLVALVSALFLVAGIFFIRSRPGSKPPDPENNARFMVTGRILTWWDPVVVEDVAALPTFKEAENINRENYAGPDACEKCHQRQHESWSQHPHRWMNASADESTVLGDFSGDSSINYLGGTITCYREDGAYRMSSERGDVRRVYEVNQTIGRRFFQYYVGKLIVGPEPAGHSFYEHDHVLPVGYWLDYKEWVPTVHITEHEAPDGHRSDPFSPTISTDDFPIYARACNLCHTTFPLGDMMLRVPEQIGRYSPTPFHLVVPDYLKKNHPELWPEKLDPTQNSVEDFFRVIDDLDGLEAPQHAVTLGVSCEACHLGAKAHAEGQLKKPHFFASGHELLYEDTGRPVSYERTAENINWICGRCHAGSRPRLAAGPSTWNSTEATDAMHGACYSQMSCVNCHNPHEGIGKKWTKTPDEDDANCLTCHEQFTSDDARVRHTHHPVGSTGGRCMNCHMPKLNEGLQDVVRTHMIFSPTNEAMIESNEPNACNQCHVKEPIDWTLKHLKEWYGAEYSSERVASAYPLRGGSAAVGWLSSPRESVRLIAADSLTKAGAKWALPDLIECLDDPYLLNRQFARRGIETMLDTKLDDFGYHFYMTSDERQEPLRRIRAILATKSDMPR
ncbi:MAG TPA: multiheme c-type cytochrome [Pirellulaceae bacterium]|nr:multiheme c-type cytochrome [Pirellulaceae bacterium]